MVANIAANMYGLYPNIYNNQIAMNDLSGLNLYYPTGMCVDPMLSMSGSIFGGITPGMGMMPGMGMGMPMQMMPPTGMMPGAGSNSYEDYYKQYEKYQDFMIDSQVRQQQKMRNANMKLKAPEEGIQGKLSVLQDKIIRNEQQQIKEAFDSYVESVKNLYGDVSDADAKSRAIALYKEATKKSLLEDIREHGRDSFTQGVIQTMSFGLFNRKTAEETVSELTGQPVGTEENAKKIAGNVVGGALVGGTAIGISGWALKGAKIASKSKTAWGIAIGAIAGAAAAICGWASK